MPASVTFSYRWGPDKFVNTKSEDWATVDYQPIDVRVLIARLWKQRWWIAAVAVVFGAAAAAYAFTALPVYRVASVLVPAGAERSGMSAGLNSAMGQLGGLASLAGINLGGGGDLETEEALAVLRSREFTERFITDLKLMPVLFAKRWDAEKQGWREDKRQPTLAEAYKYFNKEVRSVTRDKKTGLVTLQLEWTDRQQAAAWANELVQRLNAEMRARAIAKADASIGYLEKEQADTTVVTTRDAISRLMEAQIKQRMLANVTIEYAFRVVDRALPPDDDDYIWPRRMLLLAGGLMLGGVLSSIGVLLISAFSPLGRGSVARGELRNTESPATEMQ